MLLTIPVNAQDVVGLYVNDFKNIIGDTVKETELLNYAQTNSFNYLILYNLSFIHSNIFAVDDITESLPLASFIETAKTTYGIVEVAAVGEKNSSFDKIKTYNSFYPTQPNKRFDVFNLEFEFWNSSLVDPTEYYCTNYLTPNGLPCTIAGAFDYYDDQLALMKAYGDANGITAETYIGYPSVTQSEIITLNTHRVLVHYYRTSDVYGSGDSIYQYNSYRIEDLAQHPVKILPIFSSRPAHMYTWLLSNPITQPYDTFMNGVNAYDDQLGAWKTNVTFDGYVWYRYTELIELYNIVLNIPVDAIENKFVMLDNANNLLVFKNFNAKDIAFLYDLNGRKIKQFNVKNRVDVSFLTSGIYILKVNTSATVFTKKIICN